MSAKTEKCCSDNNHSVCDYNDFARLRFFHGMLLDDKDFRAEQQYHANKRRFLNRMLHGSGVVCGLELSGETQKRNLTVSRGLALDCSGNEIWVPHEVPIDICSLLPPPQKGKGPCEETEPGKPRGYYIGIRYQEKATNPVSVYLPSGSCEERTCENSRIKEGYCIELVDCCAHEEKKNGVLKGLCDCKNGKAAASSGNAKQGSALSCRKCTDPGPNATSDQKEQYCECLVLEEFCEHAPECAECCCCDDPCFVVLGRIEVNDQCQIESICNNDCRKYVLTPHLFRHMIIGALAGFEEKVIFKVNGTAVTPPTATEIADNPIKALCWVLENVVSGKASTTMTGCGQQTPRTDTPPRTTEIIERIDYMEERSRKLNDELDFLTRQFNKLNADLNDVRVDNLIKKNPAPEPPDKKPKK